MILDFLLSYKEAELAHGWTNHSEIFRDLSGQYSERPYSVRGKMIQDLLFMIHCFLLRGYRAVEYEYGQDG